MAPGVIGLELDGREAPLERDRQAVVVRHCRAHHFRYAAETRVGRRRGQSGEPSSGSEEAPAANHGIAKCIYATILRRLPNSVITDVVEVQRHVLSESLLEFQVPLLELRQVDEP